MGTDAGALDGISDDYTTIDVDGSFFAMPDLDEAGLYQMRMRAVTVDDATGIETVGDWGTPFAVSVAAAELPKIVDLALAVPDVDDPTSTVDPTVTGRVSGLDDPAYAVIQVNLNPDEDEVPDKTIVADVDGTFTFTAEEIPCLDDTSLAFRVVTSDLFEVAYGRVGNDRIRLPGHRRGSS